jgi:hypothetical protein
MALAVVTMVSALVWAQQQQRGGRGGGVGGGFGTLALLSQKSVQNELKLSEDQVKKVKELTDKQRESFRGLRDLSQEERQKKMQERTKANEKAVAEILKADQIKRVKQISWQLQGPRAFSDPAVADALKLTDQQKEKVKTIQQETRTARGDRQGGGNREEARKKAEAARKSANEKLMNVLTTEQKTKWKELTGEPFKGEISRPQPGGRNRGASRSR